MSQAKTREIAAAVLVDTNGRLLLQLCVARGLDRKHGIPCHASNRVCVFLLLLSGLTVATAEQQLRYNPYTGRREYAPEGAIPQYNPYTRRRELVGPGETLQYNPYTKKREYAPEGAVPHYNPYTKQRQLVAPN
jgi:hypothetical protein